MTDLYNTAMNRLMVDNQMAVYLFAFAVALFVVGFISYKSPARKYISWIAPTVALGAQVALWGIGLVAK